VNAIEGAFDRHERVALYLSGGKDSLACLYLLEDYWPRLTVVWGDGGDAPRETVAMMQRIAATVPNFLHVRTSQAAVHAEYGWPTDLIPAASGPCGDLIVSDAPRLQSRYDCCRRVVWEPVHAAVLAGGFTLLVRGQKDADALRPAARSGYIEGGVETLNPIEGWTDDEVFLYLAARGVEVPTFYQFTKSNPDCVRCTGYLDERRGAYLREYEPEAFEEYRARLALIAREVGPLVATLGAELAEVTRD